jgi:DNA-binding CsgD family transcriptional regulator/PAS domain-containing protein
MVDTSRKPDAVELSRLISLAYEAPFLSSGWRDFTSAAARLMHAPLAMIHHMDSVDQAKSFHIAGGIDESFSRAFTPRWAEGWDDVYLQAMLGQPAGTIRLSSEIVAPDVAHRTEIYQQLAAPWKLEHFVFASLGNQNGATSVLSLGRCIDDEPFTTADIDVLTTALLPHLCRSISVHTSITSIRQNNTLLAALIDIAPCGIVVFDTSGQPLLVNERAAALFAQDKGIALRNGKLRTTDSRAQAMLDAALLNATALISQGQSLKPVTPVSVPRNGSAQPCQIVFSPLRQLTETVHLPQRAACVALIYDEQNNHHPGLPADLASAYGLSKAEVRVCKALLTGKSAQEVADTLNISPNTVKTHLSRIFHKTSVHSQAALLHLLTTRAQTWN